MTYEDELNELTNKTLQLLSLGVDTKECAKKIKSIIKKDYSSSALAAYYTNTNNFVEDELLEIKNELSGYDFILSFYNYCNKIKPTLLEMFKKPKDEINIDELNSYINKMKNYLINLYNDKNNKKSDKLLSSIYEIVYYLIELEIIKTNKSTLYDFIKNKNIDIRYINSIIMSKIKDINKISGNDITQIIIKGRLDDLILKLNNNSLNINYFNIEIIKLLLMLEKNYDAYKELEDDFDSKLQKLSNQDKDIYNTKVAIGLDLEGVSDSLCGIKRFKSELKDRIIALMLTLSIVLPVGFGIKGLSKKLNSPNVYSKETEIVSTLNDDREVNVEEYISFPKVKGNEQYIDILSPWENSEDGTLSRDVLEYDVTSLGLNIDNLDDVDIDNIKIKPDCYTETIPKENQDELQKYDGDITELRNVSYTYQGKKLLDNYKNTLYFFYFIYIVSLLILALKINHELDGYPFLEKAIYDYKHNKKNEKENREYLEKNISRLLEYINENKELREEFNKLFNENIDLLNDSEELKIRLDIAISKFEDYDKSTEMILKMKKELE